MEHVQAPFIQLYRINALRLLGCLAAAFLLFSQTPPVSSGVKLLIDAIGTMAIFVAIAGRGWSLFYIGGRKNAELIISGPYSMTRNPLYLFSLIGVAGVAAQTNSLLATIIICGLAYLAFARAIRGEELYLASRYGAAFDDYRRSTPRLWPDFSLWQEGADMQLRSAHAIGSLRDGVVFLAAWFGVECIQLAQSAGLVPLLWHLPV
jgi:protein-S-isoprenylcysteine O-methyltransferase Ste14